MTLAPQSTLLYVKQRLREFIPPQSIDDDALLRYTNQGYQQLCEQADALLAVAVVADVADQAEYSLPTNHFKTVRVYRGGQRLSRVSDLSSETGVRLGYFQYGTKLGVSPTPSSSAGSTIILYTRTPAAVTSWNSTLDSEFPPEMAYGIVHYVRWRTDVSIGGEARVATMDFHRGEFDRAVSTLRRHVRTVNMARIYRAGTARDLPRQEVA